MFPYRYPRRHEDESQEEFNERVAAFEAAESQYEDECIERYYEEKYES